MILELVKGAVGGAAAQSGVTAVGGGTAVGGFGAGAAGGAVGFTAVVPLGADDEKSRNLSSSKSHR